LISSSELLAQVDEHGRLVLPPEAIVRLGLTPGAQVRIDQAANAVRLRRPVSHLAKVYIEPTDRCNLECRTCIRQAGHAPAGEMTVATFARVIEGLSVFTPRPSVFFGGFGEPLAHPRIVEMVTQAKASGARVELITNGTLLDETRSRQLIQAGLDVLWVSLDGATPASYADVRLGALLPPVLANVTRFRDLRPSTVGTLAEESVTYAGPEIGIAFVAMKRNVADLPAVLRLGRQLGATRFSVTNVLPYTEEMCAETLYPRVLTDTTDSSSRWQPRLNLPRLDATALTRDPLYTVSRGSWQISLAGNDAHPVTNRCPFIESGATAINWRGDVSPCLPLLRDHVGFLDRRERASRRWAIGNVAERGLAEVWNAPEYVAFRERVQRFDFSPCAHCGGCELAETNEQDCFGNTFPTCGGCLWAHGVIQCP
jgi:MoaA/NifB/PqqE/SkfB family radical SAM enzyme